MDVVRKADVDRGFARCSLCQHPIVCRTMTHERQAFLDHHVYAHQTEEQQHGKPTERVGD